MASLPFSSADARLPSNTLPLSASTIRNIPVAPHPGPRFADFQFRTIGQQPELLKRISAPNPDMQYDHDSDLLSPPLPDQSNKTLVPPEGDSAKRPSLRDRLSLLESPPTRTDENGDVTMANPLELRPAFDFRMTQNVPTIATSMTQPPRLSSSPQSLRTPFPQNCGLKKEPELQDIVFKEKAIKKAGAASATNESRLPIITGSQIENRISPPFFQSSTQANGASSLLFSGESVPSLAALRTLQSRLSSSLSNFIPISTANALAAAQSAKDQCTEVLATAHRAHTLAQQASLSAQDSMVAAQECLTLAAAVQNRADLALSAVEKIRSGQEIGTKGECEYNASVKALKDDFHQLAEWLSQWEDYESKRQLEERENEKRKKKLNVQLELDLNNFSAKKQSYDIITHSEPSMISIREALTVEDEADAATRAWNQHREQSAERKRLADDELRKREAEAELERQKLQAQSEADARHAELEKKLQAEKHKAEEEEKSRQEKETLELQRQQQEMEITRFLRSQKQAQDDLAKVADEEKKKAQAAGAEKLMKRQKMAESDAKREVILERMKRLAMEAQPPVSADPVHNISDNGKEKQSTACLTNPPSQHAFRVITSGPSHAEFGNDVSKKTLLTNSPQNEQQNRSLPDTTRLDESLTSNPTSSVSSIRKSSTIMQNGVKSHEVPPNILSSIDKQLLPDSSTTRIPSNHVRDANRKSGDGVCDNRPSRLSSLSSLPPLTPSVSLSPVLDPLATISNDFEDTHSEINIHFTGPDMGNVSVVPPSRIPPVSLEAQRANLRLFMDENGFPCAPGASGVDERKRTSSRKPLTSSHLNGDQMCRTSSASNQGTDKKVKLEPIHDVVLPTRSAPPPIKVAPTSAAPAAKPKLPDFKKIKISQTTVTQETSSSKELPASTQTILPSESLVQPPEPVSTQSNCSASANSSVLSKEKEKEKGRSAAVRRNVPPLKSNGQTPSLEDVMNQTFQGNDLDLPVSPRMGPDAAMTDGWAQPVVDDPLSKAQRKQPSFDRSSPYSIVPPVSRLVPPQRPRPGPRIDHYSPPRRIPDKDYSRDRRRSGSVEYEYSRGGLSPQSKYNDDRRSLLSDDMPPAVGRKRYRDDDTDDVPPPRRPRYVSPTFRRDDYVQPSLALRLESEKPWNSHGGSSYRPVYNDSNSQSRNTKNQRYPSYRSQPIPPQGSSSYDESPPSTQFNQQRQFGRNDMTKDTRLPLINRFTDSAEQRRVPRSAGNQALEQRISKPKTVPLINRLEDAN